MFKNFASGFKGIAAMADRQSMIRKRENDEVVVLDVEEARRKKEEADNMAIIGKGQGSNTVLLLKDFQTNYVDPLISKTSGITKNAADYTFDRPINTGGHPGGLDVAISDLENKTSGISNNAEDYTFDKVVKANVNGSVDIPYEEYFDDFVGAALSSDFVVSKSANCTNVNSIKKVGDVLPVPYDGGGVYKHDENCLLMSVVSTDGNPASASVKLDKYFAACANRRVELGFSHIPYGKNHVHGPGDVPPMVSMLDAGQAAYWSIINEAGSYYFGIGYDSTASDYWRIRKCVNGVTSYVETSIMATPGIKAYFKLVSYNATSNSQPTCEVWYRAHILDSWTKLWSVVNEFPIAAMAVSNFENIVWSPSNTVEHCVGVDYIKLKRWRV